MDSSTTTGQHTDETSPVAGPHAPADRTHDHPAGDADEPSPPGDDLDVRADLDVLLVGTFGGGGIHQYVDSQSDHLGDRVRVRTYDMYTDWGGSGVLWFIRSLLGSLWAAVGFPFRRRPDVVHVHTAQAFSFVRASFYVLFAAAVWRRPVVLHVHGSSFHEFLDTDSRLLSALQRLVFGASDRVIVLSGYWKDVLEAHVPADRIHVLPNAVDPGDYIPQYRPSVPHVAFVSGLFDRKGVPELVAAIDRLEEETTTPFRVSIGGKGPRSDAVAALADRNPSVEYLGYLSEAEKRVLLSAASIFVLPTHAEGLPIAMLEGMAGGNAVVSTPVGAIPEVVDEDNGVLVAPGDADALAAALGRLVEDPAETESMGRTNRRAVERVYSWDVAVDDLLAIYADVLDPREPDDGTAYGRDTRSQLTHNNTTDRRTGER